MLMSNVHLALLRISARRCFNATEDAHIKSMNTFETDERLHVPTLVQSRFIEGCGSLGGDTHGRKPNNQSP